MDGTAKTSYCSPGSIPDLDFRIVDKADFNGDGKEDILWRHNTSGMVYIWIMNGTANPSEEGSPGTMADLNYQIADTADFDGDGNSDILWRHDTSGAVFVWLINGTAKTSGGSPGTVADLNWQIQ